MKQYFIPPLLIILFIGTNIALGQRQSDTFYFKNGKKEITVFHSDSSFTIFYFKDEKVKEEEYWVNGSVKRYKKWYYRDSLYGYNAGNYNGLDTCREFYLNGKMKLESVYLNNKLNGISRAFYPGGAIECFCNFSSGRSDSISTTFYKNGSIAAIRNYKDGKLDGLLRYYHENGNLWTEIIYKGGKIVDVNMNLDSSGNQMEKGTLKAGNGTVFVYDENRVLISIEFYKMGKLRRIKKVGNSNGENKSI